MNLFISYRRKSWPFVHLLEEKLKNLIVGDIFVDYAGIDEADFEHSILYHLRKCDIFLLVVTEYTFTSARINDDRDWVRRELALALSLKKPIVLILVDNLSLPSPTDLPEDIRDITSMQGIPFYSDYFDVAVERLATFTGKVFTSLPPPKLSTLPAQIKLNGFSLLHTIRITKNDNDFNAVTYMAVSPDGQLLFNGSLMEESIKVWSLRTGQGLRTFADFTSNFAVSPDGQILVSSNHSPIIKVWSLLSGQELRSLSSSKYDVSCVAISSDGKMVISGSQVVNNTGELSVKIWNLHTGQELRTLKGGFLQGHKDDITCVAISPDGQTVVSGSLDETIKVWHLHTGKLLRTLKGDDTRSINSIAISPDGQIVVSGNNNDTIHAWNLFTGQKLHILSGHQSYVHSVAITPDGKTIVSGSYDRTIKLWNLSSGQELYTLTVPTKDLRYVVLSPDGQTIISCGGDTINVWKAQ